MTDAELEEKTAACVAGIFDDNQKDTLIKAAWGIKDASDAAMLADVIKLDQ